MTSSPRALDQSGVQSTLTRRPSRSTAMTTFSMGEVFDTEVVPSSLQSISPILRVATEIQNEHPRVAYLCTSILRFREGEQIGPKLEWTWCASIQNRSPSTIGACMYLLFHLHFIALKNTTGTLKFVLSRHVMS
nr:callose synthase 5 [Ipomoea batatas]